MSLETFSELKTRVTTLMARTDLASHLQDWVREAELFIFPRLRVREMEKVAPSLSVADGVVTLPDGFLEVGELRLASKMRVALTHKPTQQLFAYDEAPFGEGYGFWATIGGSLYIRPKPSDSETYWLKYVAKPAALTEAADTNAIFPAYADLYLHGALWRGFTHVRKFDSAGVSGEALASAIEHYNAQFRATKEGEASLDLMPVVCA